MICYQCETEVDYLFEDARCIDCTRLTPEEVSGVEYSDDFLGTPERERGYSEWKSTIVHKFVTDLRNLRDG